MQSLDGRVLFSGGDDKVIRQWSMSSGEVCAAEDSSEPFSDQADAQIVRTSSPSGHAKAINAIVMSKDGLVVWTASSDRTAKKWRADIGQVR